MKIKMKKILVKYLGIAVIGSLLLACESFDGGGAISKADKRIEGSWELVSYLRDGVDETASIYISNYQETFSSNGDYPRSYMEKEGDPFSETGFWELTNDNKQLQISGVSSIQDFSAENSTLSSSTYLIIKLKKDELWYHYENGGADHEFHLIAK